MKEPKVELGSWLRLRLGSGLLLGQRYKDHHYDILVSMLGRGMANVP
jgi:hypothetical protein